MNPVNVLVDTLAKAPDEGKACLRATHRQGRNRGLSADGQGDRQEKRRLNIHYSDPGG
ncbi:MAG: hypothetical protein AB1487_02235 [Thermodesulfobacteriota bacterium]